LNTRLKRSPRQPDDQLTLSLASLPRLFGLLGILALAGCAVPERVTPPPAPMPIAEHTWQQVDADIVAGSLAAKGAATGFVRSQLEQWKWLVTEKGEADFIPWFSRYTTQQWLTVKVAWYHLSHEEGGEPPADRLAAYIQEQYFDRVLAPVAREIDPTSLVGQGIQRYVRTLNGHLQPIPHRYGIPEDQFKRRLATIPAIKLAPPSAHDASLGEIVSLERIEHLPAYSALLHRIRDRGGEDRVGLSKTRVSPVARNVSEQVLNKLAISSGTSAASTLVGGITGSVISLGATVLGVIWHEAGREEIETALRETLNASIADMWQSLMDDPASGVAAGIYHIADHIENHLPPTFTTPVRLDSLPEETRLPEQSPPLRPPGIEGQADDGQDE